MELIAEKGYANTSTSEIAKRAGVAEGTIFRHYRTKKDLLIAIVTPTIVEFSVPLFAEKMVETVFQPTHASLKDLLYHFVKNRFEFAEANVAVLKITLQEMAFYPEIQATFKKNFMEKVYPVVNQSFDYFKQKGELKDIPNNTIIRMTISAILGLIINRFILQPEKEWNNEWEIRQTVDFILEGISAK